MRTITTTIRPDVEIEVDEAEFRDLNAQGLIATGGDTNEEKAAAVKPKPKEGTNA